MTPEISRDVNRGGPMKYAHTIGVAKMLADIRQFAQDDPVSSRPSPLIVDLVEPGVTLQSLNLAA